jgi:hypothetical protein
MLEIIYGHKIENDVLYRNKLSIGRDFPEYGQLANISLIKEGISIESGKVLWDNYEWGFNIKDIFKRFF